MSCNLSFDSKVYSVDAVMATAYWCADKMVADVSTVGSEIVVTLKGADGKELEDRDVDAFKTMLIHNQIRHRLSIEFAPIERAIVEKAFLPVTNQG